MTKEYCPPLKYDPEFERICPKPAPLKYHELEMDLLNNGCQKPIQVWNNIILYNYLDYNICRKWSLSFQIENRAYLNRDEALYFTCQTILKSEKPTGVYHRYVTGKCYLSMKRILSDVFSGKRKCPFSLSDKIFTGESERRSALAVAESIFGITPTTISLYGAYAKAMDAIAGKAPEISVRLFRNELSVSIRECIRLSKLPSEKMTAAFDHLQTHKPVPAVKQMPSYIPDDALSGLTLTIPTWISSIKHTQEKADLLRISPDALQRLDDKLTDLCGAAALLKNAIKEARHA